MKLNMPSNKILKQKVPLIVSIFIWYYRIFGITFGGLVLRSGQCLVNKNLKLFCNMLQTTIIILLIILSRTIIDYDVSNQLYHSGFKLTYHLLSIRRGIRDILVIVNLFYYQFRGFNLFEVLMKYKIRKNKNKIFIFMLIIFQVSAMGVNVMKYLIYSENFFVLKTIHYLIILYYTIFNSAIHFITWGNIQFL